MIDEIPVGQGKKIQLDEYPPDFNPDTLNTQEAQPLKNRLKSAVFKIRVQAYEEALEQLDEVEIENLNAMILETNPQCQDKGLNVVQKYIATKGPILPNVMRDIIKNLLEKAYTNLKVRTKVNQIFIFIFENGHKLILFEQIINMLTHKNPKVAQGSITLILELLQQFGAKRMDNLKPFFSSINKLIEGQQAGTKNDAIAFYKEATKWLGKSIELHSGSLNEKLKQELNAIVEALPKDHAMKAIRCEAVEAPPTDLYEMADPVDAFKSYEEKWCNELLALEKWVDKKEKLEVLLKSVSQPKLLNHNNLYNIVQALKRLIGDNNIAISNTSIKICGFIAQGLRKGFQSYAKILLQVIPLKLRDKKQQVVDEAIGCLKKFLYTLTLDEMYESLISLLEDKAPNTRVNVFQVFEMGIDENPRDKLIKLNNLKALVLLSKKYVEDGNAEVRNKAIQLLAKISAKVYAGTLGIDLKGDKLQKYQSLMATYQSQFEEKEPKKQQLQSLQQIKPNPAPAQQQQPKLQFVQEEVQIKQQPIQKIEQPAQQSIQQNLYEKQTLQQPQQQQQVQQQAQQQVQQPQQQQVQQPQQQQIQQPYKQQIQQEPQINQYLPSQILQQQPQSNIILQYQQHPSFSANPQSTIITIQEAPQQHDEPLYKQQPTINQEIPQKQQNDQFKTLLGQYNQEVPQKQIDQKPKMPPPAATLQQVLELKAQLQLTNQQVQQSLNQNLIQYKQDLSNQHYIQNRFNDEKSNEKLKSDDRMKALEQAKSMLGLPSIQQVKASKKRNQENTQNLSNIDRNIQDRVQDLERKNTQNDDNMSQYSYQGQVQGYKSVRDSKRGEMIGKRKDFDKEKQKRLQDYDKNGFVCYSFSEPQWFLLKGQITQTQLQQPVIDKMFSINPQQHISGMNIIKAKIKDIYPISDLLIKWAYMISYMGESIQLQQEVQIFFMDIIDKLKQQNQQLNHMEAKLLFIHTQMLCVVFASYYNEKLPNRVIPLILTNLVQVRKMGFSIQEFMQQFAVSNEINFSAQVIYNYITESLEQYQDQTKQSDILARILKQIQRDMSRIVSPSRMTIEQTDNLIASDIPQRKKQHNQELYLEFLAKCEQIKKDQFIYTIQGNLLEFLELTFAVGSFIEKPDQKKQFLGSLLQTVSFDKFLKNLQYDEFYQLYDFFIQKINIENEQKQVNTYSKEILDAYNQIIWRLVTLGDIHYLYETLISIIIKTRNEGLYAKYKYISSICVRMLNKVIGYINSKFHANKFPQILKKIEEFIQLCQQYPVENFNDLDRINFQCLQLTFTSLMTYGNTPQIMESFLGMETNNLFKQWYTDYNNKQKNIVGSTDQGLKQIINSLRLDFERSSELFVAHLQKFQNPNWKQYVTFLNTQQIRYIEDRLKQELTQEQH